MKDIRKTKIVCTLGPACDDEETLRALVEMGMDVARLNFSHGTHEEHLERIIRLRKICAELDQPVALLMDTKGPEIRTGDFAEKEVLLEEGSEVIIRHADMLGNANEFSVSYKMLDRDLSRGDRVLLDDGLVELEVTKIQDNDVYTRVMNSGVISSYKSVNLPNISTQLPAITENDRADLKFAAEHDFDFVATSFTRRAADIQEIRQLLGSYGATRMHLIAKIENREGVERFDEILDAADGAMVARGDLGVELPVQDVPATQKMMIKACLDKGKTCITATQMLDSMIRNPRPTRAEISDIANAIMDGTDALMLSGETAAGKYPVQALKTMVDTALGTESYIDYWGVFFKRDIFRHQTTVSNAIAHAACTTAMDVDAQAIITVTQGGRTPRLVSQHRPGCPIIATTTTEKSRRRLKLTWGVSPILMGETESTDEIFGEGVERARKAGLVKDGDMVVIVGGTPLGMSGSTNTLKVETVGNILAQGKGIGRVPLIAEVLVLKESDVVSEMQIEEGSILVAERLTDEVLHLIQRAGGLIVEDPNERSYAVMAAGLLDLPLIYACENCTDILQSGSLVVMDPTTGTVR